MVIYPNNYSNFRTIMEVIMKNKWLLCILLMLFLPFGLFAQVAPPLEKQKTETQEAPENNNEVTTNSDTNTDGDAGKTIKGVINDEQGETIIGANVFKDFLAGMRDFFGGRSGSYEKVLREAKDTSLREMEERARNIGANAIVGIDIDYETIGEGNSMIMVSCSGTAVRI